MRRRSRMVGGDKLADLKAEAQSLQAQITALTTDKKGKPKVLSERNNIVLADLNKRLRNINLSITKESGSVAPVVTGSSLLAPPTAPGGSAGLTGSSLLAPPPTAPGGSAGLTGSSLLAPPPTAPGGGAGSTVSSLLAPPTAPGGSAGSPVSSLPVLPTDPGSPTTDNKYVEICDYIYNEIASLENIAKIKQNPLTLRFVTGGRPDNKFLKAITVSKGIVSKLKNNLQKNVNDLGKGNDENVNRKIKSILDALYNELNVSLDNASGAGVENEMISAVKRQFNAYINIFELGLNPFENLPSSASTTSSSSEPMRFVCKREPLKGGRRRPQKTKKSKKSKKSTRRRR